MPLWDPRLGGATPIQNIGAYGQEVSESIESVECLNLKSLEPCTLPASQCSFEYRSSIFKNEGRGRFVITQVNYVLRKNYVPKIKYEELKKAIEEALPSLERKIQDPSPLPSDTKGVRKRLQMIRNEVLKLRKNKGCSIVPRILNHALWVLFL